MGSSVKKVIAEMDRYSANYGMATQTQNTMPYQPTVSEVAVMPAISYSAQAPAQTVNIQPAVVYPANPVNTQYSANPMIQAKTKGQSTFMIKITVAKTGTGSGNTENPVWLFGANAYNNCSRPYNVVANAGQAVTTEVVNGKNVIKFTYGSGGNTSTYTVSLGTTGEYPFVLNSQVGKKGLYCTGIQMEISDNTYASQLTNEINTFYVNEFGKAVTNDLTTPTDLYQYATNGVFLPHEFVISADNGIQLSVLEQNGFEVKLYFYANPLV